MVVIYNYNSDARTHEHQMPFYLEVSKMISSNDVPPPTLPGYASVTVPDLISRCSSSNQQMQLLARRTVSLQIAVIIHLPT
jgi:hypothetical protein